MHYGAGYCCGPLGLSPAGKSWERVEDVIQNCPNQGGRKLGCLNINAHPSLIEAAPLEILTFPAFGACLGHGPSLFQQPENILRQRVAGVHSRSHQNAGTVSAEEMPAGRRQCLLHTDTVDFLPGNM